MAPLSKIEDPFFFFVASHTFLIIIYDRLNSNKLGAYHKCAIHNLANVVI